MSAQFKDELGPVTYPFVNLFKENRLMSNREREIASMIAEGMSNKDIAGHLFITEKRVKFHNTNIYKKVGVISRAQLIVAVVRYRGSQASKTESSL